MNDMLTEISNIADQLDDYAALITAISTFVLAIITVFLWIENRALRKAGISPDIVAYLSPHPDGTGAIEFVLANVGRGPAFDVNFQLEYDEEDFGAHKVHLLNDKDRMPMSVLPQDEKLKTLFGISFELYGKINDTDIGPLKDFAVVIEYRDAFGRKRKARRNIDIRQFAGLRGLLSKSAEGRVAQLLDKIEGHLSTIARQAGRFSAFVDTTELGDKFVNKTKGEE